MPVAPHHRRPGGAPGKRFRAAAGGSGGLIGRPTPLNAPCMLATAPPAATSAAAAPEPTRRGLSGDRPLAMRPEPDPRPESIRLSPEPCPVAPGFRRGRPGRPGLPVPADPDVWDGDEKCMLLAIWSTACSCRRVRSWRACTDRKSGCQLIRNHQLTRKKLLPFDLFLAALPARRRCIARPRGRWCVA
jgi:hypothetical protein